MKKFSVILSKQLGLGTETIKFNKLTNAKSYGFMFINRLVDLMEFDGKNWKSILL